MDVNAEQSQRAGSVIRMSLGWLLVGLTGVVLLGVAGGYAAVRIWSPRSSLLTSSNGGAELVSTVQQVTISPNMAAAEVVDAVQRAVVLFGTADGSGNITPSGFGTVVTNDGLIVTTVEAQAGDMAVFDWQRRRLPTQYLGRDGLFGLAYWRVTEGILPTIDVRDESVSPGAQLWLLNRNEVTWQPRASIFAVEEAILPPQLMPKGISRLLAGDTQQPSVVAGSPIVDEEGKLAGIITQPGSGFALPANLVRASMNRVTSGQREANPLAELGLEVRYAFAPGTDERQPRFGVEIIRVLQDSPAAAAKIAAGDILVGAGGADLAWQESVLPELLHPRPLTLTVWRDAEERQVVIQP